MRVSGQRIRFAALACSAAFVAVPAAFAQTEPGDGAAAGRDEIVVTAQRRQELSRDVPISVTTLDAGRLAAGGVEELADVARLTPGIRFDTVTNFVQPTVRGIGTAVNVSGGGANVGIYVDGFYDPNPLASNIALAKVINVQVLKGPQGTLFGRNTTGGAILVTTAEPSVEPSAMAEASYGRFNTQRYRGYATTGLSEKVAFDIEGQYRKTDGFVTNIVDGNDKIGKGNEWFLRMGIKGQLSDNVSVLVRFKHSDTDDNAGSMRNPFVGSDGQPLIIKPLLGSGLYTTDPDEVAIDSQVSFRSKTDTIQGTIKADLGDADLTSYTQFRKDKSSMFNDFDFTAAPIFLGHLRTQAETFSQELLLTSQPGGPLQWTVGLFFFDSQERWDFAIATTPPEIPIVANNTQTRTYAAYADATYELSPSFFITAGARYSHDTVTDAWFLSTQPATFGQRFDIPDYESDHLTPRVVLRYKPSEQSSLYASYTRGYKAGLLNVGGEQFTPVRPESISAFEVGYKYDDRALSLDLAAFYYKYKDLQVSTYFSNTALISNAAKSEIYGLDGQIRYRLPMGLELNAGAAYTHARYERFENTPTYVYCADTEPCAGFFRIQPVNIVDGKMQRSPEFTGNIGARYPIAFADGSKLTLSGNLYYTSSFFFDAAEQYRQQAYEVLALRAEWTDASDHFKIAVFGDNITNNRYRNELWFNDLGIGNSWNSPTIYGISLGVKY